MSANKEKTMETEKKPKREEVATRANELAELYTVKGLQKMCADRKLNTAG